MELNLCAHLCFYYPAQAADNFHKQYQVQDLFLFCFKGSFIISLETGQKPQTCFTQSTSQLHTVMPMPFPRAAAM